MIILYVLTDVLGVIIGVSPVMSYNLPRISGQIDEIHFLLS
jgi:hypothetical protein